MKYLDIRRNTNNIAITINNDKVTKPLTNDFFDNKEKYLLEFKKIFNNNYKDNIITVPIDKTNLDLFLSIINDKDILKGYIEEKNNCFNITIDDNGFTTLSDNKIYCENIFYYLSNYF